MHTPWGPSQHQKSLAEGITLVETASHGGIHINAARIAAMPQGLRDFTPFTGKPGWYEEDCDWAIVALAFPEHFSDDMVIAAHRGVMANPKYYKCAYDWLTSHVVEVTV